MMFARDPTDLYARHGRQLLVTGADFDGQQQLFRLGATLSATADAAAQAAGEAAARYLVGAGLGRACVPTDWCEGLQALDPQLVLYDTPKDVAAPVVHIHLAARPWGAGVDIVHIDAAQVQHVTTLHVRTGSTLHPADAVAVGASVAALIVEAWLGFAPLPAHQVIDLSDPTDPQVTTTAQVVRHAPTYDREPPAWWGEFLNNQAQLQALDAACAAAYPHEACGLLLRNLDESLEVVVSDNLQDRLHAADPQTHVRSARTAFALDTRLIATAERNGAQVLAIWHSHCDAPAHFSQADRDGAAADGQPLYPGVAWLVVAVQAGKVADRRCFDWQGAELGGTAPQP